MAFDRLKETAFLEAASRLAADVGDLVTKEARLAKAELASKVSKKARAIVWIAIGGALAVIAAMTFAQAIAYGIASLGLATHWSFLIVAVLFLALAGVFFLKGRADLSEELTPNRTLQQIKQDLLAVKEQLS
jgi:hypothetical protein